ncbi:MAG: hypothetical protein PHY93_10075 [Bacteriovorax sp.]|nr:hypothetical protein [Bacteriovorax sp.]
MTIKKTFVTTSSFILTAALLSQIYSFKNTSSQSQSINYSAFINLAQNIKSVSTQAPDASVAFIASEDIATTNDIIKVIDKEITKKISRTRYSIRVIKAPLKEAKNIISNIKIKKEITSPKLDGEDLSSYEINNTGLINLYALSVDEIAFTKFESTKNAISYNEEIKDEVAVNQASTTLAPIEADELTTTQPSPVSEAPEVSDKEDKEMVMFDYSDKSAPAAVAQTIDQKLYERPISKTVQQAISREIGNTPIKKLIPMNTQRVFSAATQENITKIDNQEIDLNSDNNITYDYSNHNSKTTQTDAKAAMAEADAFMTRTNTSESRFTLRAKEINLSTQKRRQALAFEFVPDYDRSERSDDQGTGEIAFGYSLNGEMNTQTGVVQAQGMISTRVELNLAGKANLEVPLINEEGMQKFLQKQGLSIEGNLLTLAINPSIIDTEIDSRFAERFFFDKNFKPLTSANNASFVMYAGVKSGNVMIRYLLSNKESAQKIVYVGDGEMYFEDAEFVASNRETFIFTTRTLLGQKRKELIIDGGAISYFNTNITATKKALNAYDIKIPSLVSGMRKYLEFKHLKDSVFVGSSNEKDIEVPSNDFISKVLEMNQVSGLKDRCVVQINLSKDLREIKANGKNRSGEMFVETSYLDKDGNFSRDSFEMAEKAFIVGDMEGQFNIKLDYTDGSTEFLKTFCSEGSYLVEQL